MNAYITLNIKAKRWGHKDSTKGKIFTCMSLIWILSTAQNIILCVVSGLISVHSEKIVMTIAKYGLIENAEINKRKERKGEKKKKERKSRTKEKK